MFEFFKKASKDEPEPEQDNEPEENIEQEDEEKATASVTYYIKEDSTDVFLDIFISDYEQETLKKMAKILSGLSTLRLSVETMSMVKDSLVEAGAEEIFVDLVRYTMKYTEKETDSLKNITDKIKEATQEKEQEDQPWIKPSEIIR